MAAATKVVPATEDKEVYIRLIVVFSLALLTYYMKILFIVSLAAALLLPINSIIEVKSFTYPPGLRNPALRGSRLLSSINHSIHQGIDCQF